MKWFAIALAAVLLAGFGARASNAHAGTWPARCTTWKCVNSHLNALHTTDVALHNSLKKLAWVNPCLNSLAPITQFNGYLFDDGAGGAFDTTGLDYTLTGDVPDYWLSVVDPSCAPATAATVRSGSKTLRVPGGHVFRLLSPTSAHK